MDRASVAAPEESSEDRQWKDQVERRRWWGWEKKASLRAEFVLTCSLDDGSPPPCSHQSFRQQVSSFRSGRVSYLVVPSPAVS